MAHPSLTRRARRSALIVAGSLAAACGGSEPPPPTPDPPQVALTVPASIISDDKLQVIVTVSGCEGGSTLNVNDRETLLRTFPHSGGTMTLTLERNDIPYATAGLAANLSLNAVATCSDGRTNRSQPAPVSYFPVQRRIVEPQNAGQVVTDHFVIDGTSANPTFLGCGVPPTEISTLYRVNLSGKVTGTVGMPIACTPETVITERNPISGKRWVWTPNVGAFAVDADLRITARTTTDIGPTQLTVLPGGDAIIVNRIDEVRRLSHNHDGTSESVAEVKWLYAPTTLESVIAPPLVRADGMILIASLGTGPDASRTDVTVTELYAGETGEQGAGGTARAAYKLRTFARNERLPLGAFNDTGNTLFLGLQLGSEQSQVIACAANQDECEGARLQWTSPALPVPLAHIVYHPGASRLVAVGKQRVWFLDASGQIRNRDNRSIDANGALNVLQVLRRPGSPELFLLNAPARGLDGAPTLPNEIVAVDQTSSGEARELFRHQVVDSLSGAIDPEGRLWVRTGFDVVQTLPLSDYRRYRP
ncbi:hypothetical protein [Myxococcus virescens]|uniref:Uncharacterized protein n=1 Tax=Myxococcus virescens TaxID=83456 RepID=A0A511HDI0_9BACT|nr:hypothetical protein [Myxococcus virescens]GEL71602.1 hypothetical protein MVI01_33860 [Myxococcus virescens]SDF00748.1 hypothetical protein SAMN04488504_11759 [Myxococcus virescens]